MRLHAEVIKKTFHFNFKARTSRGLMRDKVSWFIKIAETTRPGVVGIGECGPLPGLSMDAIPDFEERLNGVVASVNGSDVDLMRLADLAGTDLPSVTFALECAALDLVNGGSRTIFKTEFVAGSRIPINGLIWMGDMDFMMNQINQRIADGFRCIKLKVGGLDFDRECDTLGYIRKRYYKENITIRLDANGAFKLDDVLFKLHELAKYDVQSIEQPIKPGLMEMEELCRKSPVAVAFDEELIGKNTKQAKENLLKALKPHYLVLKPTLLGGFGQCREWIELAEAKGIGWWITSMLESSIGLNAICQFASSFKLSLHQGLGTGSIYQDNIPSPLTVESGEIFYDPQRNWDVSSLG